MVAYSNVLFSMFNFFMHQKLGVNSNENKFDKWKIPWKIRINVCD